jgi:predicted phage terminase large subunit-like protein
MALPTQSEVLELLPYLNPHELAELDRLLTANEPTLGFTDFKRAVFPEYEHAPHLELLDAALTQATLFTETNGKQGLGHILVSMPPRHGKTETISKKYPAWHLGRNPNHRIMLVSYGMSLAKRNSRAVRNLIRSQEFKALFPGVSLADDSKAVDAWNLQGYEGGMDAAGIGGANTGKGGQVIIIDDPIKNREQAESVTYREKVWTAFADDLYTRRNKGGVATIIVMTRWHTDDLIGRLLTHEGEKWHYIRLPALAEADDTLHRPVGTALWPNAYPVERLRETEKTLGPYAWAGLYQQRPAPAEGGIFKREWFKRRNLHELPEMTATVRYWDLAMSEKTNADYTAGVLMGIGTDGCLYILDVQHRQIDWGAVTGFIADTMMADGANVLQGVEKAGYMSRAVTSLNADPRLRGYSVFGYAADKDKLTRALPFAAKAAAGMVRVVDAGWTNDYIEEMCSFPSGSHDDQIDATSGALAMFDDGLHDAAGGMNYADTTYSNSAY